jgi:DNA (cytosine-5)-methyltransferase 1
MLTYGSLFSGVGGLDLGIEASTGARCAWQVEKDTFCRTILSQHWPEVPRYVDVETASFLPKVDIVCGGFPCQDISVAGRGAGVEDGEHSGLWREFARIVDEVAPRIVIVENSPALASRGLDRVIRDLAALGFVGSWDVVSAAQVGAPHLRRRLFIVAAHPDRVGVRVKPEWHARWCDAVQRARKTVVVDDGKSWPFALWNRGAPESCVHRMDDGLFPGMDMPSRRHVNDSARFHALGNACVQQAAQIPGFVAAGLLGESW